MAKRAGANVRMWKWARQAIFPAVKEEWVQFDPGPSKTTLWSNRVYGKSQIDYLKFRESGRNFNTSNCLGLGPTQIVRHRVVLVFKLSLCWFVSPQIVHCIKCDKGLTMSLVKNLKFVHYMFSHKKLLTRPKGDAIECLYSHKFRLLFKEMHNSPPSYNKILKSKQANIIQLNATANR